LAVHNMGFSQSEVSNRAFVSCLMRDVVAV